MTTWRRTTLGELELESAGVIQTGPFGSQLHASDYSTSGIPVVMPTNIKDLRISEEGISRVPVEHVERLARHKLLPGDIVYSRRGDVEKCALVAEAQSGWLCGTGCLLVRVGGASVEPRFLAYSLSLPETRAWISAHAVGATMPNLNTDLLREVAVSLPSLHEQRTIAATLGALDDKIECNGRAVQLQRDLAIALLAKAASNEVSLADVASIRKGLSYKGGGLTSVTGGVPMVNMGNAANFGWLKRDGFKYYKGEFKPKHVAEPGSLIITGVEQTWKHEIIGWPLLVPDDMGPVLFTHHMLLVHFNEGCEWMRLPLWAALYSPTARSTIESLVYGTTVATLPVSGIEALKFNAPDPQSEAIPAAGALLRRSWALERENQNLAALRDILLPELLSGRLRTPVADTVS